MRIVAKLTLALVGGTCALLAVNGYLRVRREIGFFEADRHRDHDVVGRSLAAATTVIWKTEGAAPALATVEAAKQRIAPRMLVRWLDEAHARDLQVDPGTFASTPGGEPVTRIVAGGDGGATWYTYVPVDVDGTRRGAIELTEGATTEPRFARTVLVDTTKTALALMLLSALLSYAMGQWLVGRPVRTLMEKARRIGRGDFAGPVTLGQNDELGDLAREINAMCERLATTLEQLRHADRLAMVGKLASGIAHELGTPLNVVSARASMIASGTTTKEESSEYARVIHDASDRMTKIIKQLMQFARRKGLQKARTDLHRLARDTIVLLEPLAQKRDVELRVEEPDGESTALVDPAQAQQVMTNLMINAIQAIPNGGHVNLRIFERRAMPPPEVGAAEVACLCLLVEDDGAGIAKDDLQRIFEPFFTTKDVGEGTGLGLAVTYGIVREHGGWIAAESELGKGSTFRVFLPHASAP